MNLTRSRRKLLSPFTPPALSAAVAVGMTRGSTLRQQLTLGAQRDAIERFATFQQFKLARVFEDSGTCAKSIFLERDSVKEMLRYMAEERIEHIILTRVDRAFRNTGDAIVTMSTLHKIGVTVHLSEQPLPTGAMGKVMFNIMATFAEWETDIRLERQLEAGERQRALGHKSGVNVPYGYRAVPAAGGRRTKEARHAFDLEPIPEQQEVLVEILRRHARGESDAYIAKVLNTAGIPTAKAGQEIKYRGVIKPASGIWQESTVWSVRSFARCAAPETDNYDEI